MTVCQDSWALPISVDYASHLLLPVQVCPFGLTAFAVLVAVRQQNEHYTAAPVGPAFVSKGVQIDCMNPTVPSRYLRSKRSAADSEMAMLSGLDTEG